MRSPRDAASYSSDGELARETRRIQVSLATDRGPYRSVNEDAVAADRARAAVLVLDGSCGAPPGIGSERIGTAFLAALARGEDLATALASAGRALDDEVVDPLDLCGASATAVAAAFGPHRATIAHVGDCRAYLLREGALEALTRDHTLVNLARDQGHPIEATARLPPVIVRALGHRQHPVIDVCEIDLVPGDRLVLASDGVHGVLDDATIAMLAAGDARGAAHRLVVAAARHGRDNAAAIVAVVQVTGSGASRSATGPR